MDKDEHITGYEADPPTPEEEDIDLLLARYGILLDEEELSGPAELEKPIEAVTETEKPLKPGKLKKPEKPEEPEKPKTAEKPKKPKKPKKAKAPEKPKMPETPAEPERPAPPAEREENGEGDFPMEDVVASTVDSVLEERKGQERFYRRQRRKTQRRQEKLHRSKASRAADEEEFPEDEPSLIEAALVQKKRFLSFRGKALFASLLTLLYWAPTILAASGVELSAFTEDVTVRTGAYAGLQGLICLLCWPVFREGFGRRQINCHTCAGLSALLTLLDTTSLLWLPGRPPVSPLGGIALTALCLCLWGECWRAGALRESFRLASIGDPSYVADLTGNGAVKRRARGNGFYSRSMKEDAASRVQRILLPLVLAGSAVFAVLSSYGLERPAYFLWCWSAILTAGTAFALPCVYSMPFRALTKRLGKSGCAVAGLYGARQLSFSRELLVGDQDLFPPGAVRLREVKIIREDPKKAASYAGSLAAAYSCGWTDLLLAYLTETGGQIEHLDQFHVHEEGGVSASIYGETAVLGTANLIRKLSIRLPKSMEWKDGIYLAIDGEVCAIFCLVYQNLDPVRWSLGAMRRNGLTPLLAVRDPNLTPKFLKNSFHSDGGAVLLDLNDRLNLSAPDQPDRARPNALIYREGLAPYFEAVAGSKRLCRAVRWGNAIALFGSIAGTLLSFYLIFVDSMSPFDPPQLMLFMALWLLPELLLSYNVDKI